MNMRHDFEAAEAEMALAKHGATYVGQFCSSVQHFCCKAYRKPLEIAGNRKQQRERGQIPLSPSSSELPNLAAGGRKLHLEAGPPDQVLSPNKG